MSLKTKVAGSIKDISMPYAKVAGVWKNVKAVYNKINGAWVTSFLQGGVINTSFMINMGTGAGGSGPVFSTESLSNGKILVAGGFSYWNGAYVGPIVRLNANGTIDTSFSNNDYFWYITKIKVQPDGKILAGGTSFFKRYNSDGTPDTAFNATVSVPDGSVQDIGVLSDGRIVVVGRFLSWGATPVNYVVMLNSDGTLNSTFMTNIGTACGGGNGAWACVIQPDKRILIGYDAGMWNGAVRNGIVRLAPTGAVDVAFTTNMGAGGSGVNGGRVTDITLQSNGYIIVTGRFSSWNSITTPGIVRLLTTGARDTSFTSNLPTTPGESLYVSNAVQTNGNILIGRGEQYTYVFERLSSSGVVDTAFRANTKTNALLSDRDTFINVQANGNILLGGQISGWDGATIYGLVCIGGDVAI